MPRLSTPPGLWNQKIGQMKNEDREVTNASNLETVVVIGGLIAFVGGICFLFYNWVIEPFLK